MIRLKKRAAWSLLAAVLFFGIILIGSCKKDTTDPNENDDFDQKEMLMNYADNLIVPSYQRVADAIVQFNSALIIFEQAYSVSSLEIVQQKWDELYTTWMLANGYNFGPAGEEGIKKRLVEEISTFPVDTTGVNTHIASLDTAFTDFSRDTRGLLAIEFLIFSRQKTNAQLVTTFQLDANRVLYLKALVNKVQAQVGDVLTQWQSGYRDAFVDNTGTSVGSSVSMMYNEFVRSFEIIKNFKLGIPLGKKAGQVGVEPDKVEALFSENSFKYIKENILAVENNWLGKSNSADGLGWKEYIESATGGAGLIDGTQTQQNNIATALASVTQTVSMFDQINTNTTALDNLYIELQKQTRFYKSDMSSLLGISITFTDADGD